MAHNVSTTTNGGTLEDCHTNIFVLTELNGLKWCKFGVSNPSQVCTEIREDPVLCAYGRCLSQSLLCVWRRVPPASVPAYGSRIDLRLASEKELWVFWYGDEPDWKLLGVTGTLTRLDEGSWEKNVEYDTRSLLFKALHNLIERCLLTRDFIRLGRWFVRPLNVEDAADSSQCQVLAFSFSFFVHGENNVCVCVNVQSQPSVYRLTREHLSSLSASTNNGSNGRRTVILAPWSLKGVLNADDLKIDNESQARKQAIWHEWSKFYPLPPETDNVENMGYVDPVEKERQEQLKAMAVPRVVEVTVGGVRMQYPSCFVVLPGTALDGKTDKCRTNSSRNDSLTSPEINAFTSESPKFDSSKFQKRLVERVEEEMTLSRKKSTPPTSSSATATACTSNSTENSTTPTNSTVTTDDSVWDFVWETNATSGGANGLQKDFCQCSSHPSTSATSQPVPNKAQLKIGLAACGRQRPDRQAKLSKCGVFHRRSAASPAPLTNFSRNLPPLSSAGELGGPGSVGVQPAQLQDTPVVNSPILNNGLETISRPSSRVLAPTSSIQMISPAPPIVNAADASLQKPPLLTHLEQTLNFAPNLSSTSSDHIEVQSSDGTNILVFKRPDLKTKRTSGATTLSFDSLTKKRKKFDAVRILDSVETPVNDVVDSSALYLPENFTAFDNAAANFQRQQKFRLWTTLSSDEFPHAAGQYRDDNAVAPLVIKESVKEEYDNFEGVSDRRTISNTPHASVSDVDEGSYSHKSEYDVQKATCNEQHQAISPLTSMVGGTGENATYQTLPAHDFVPSASLPDNIMADSSSSSSDNEDDTAPFLSPPPSHGQDDETQTKRPKTATMIASAAALITSATSSQLHTAQANQQGSQSKNTVTNVLDFGIIYPTPPSADGANQFSPEAAPSWQDGHILTNTMQYYPESNAIASGSSVADVTKLSYEKSFGKITERPVTAKYLSTGKFGPCSKFSPFLSTSVTSRKMDDYRPRLPLVNNNVARTLGSPASGLPLMVQPRLSSALLNQQPVPPPPYPGPTRSYSGGSSSVPHWSSPPSVRPFVAEQSPMMTNSPMNSTMARTPRTPAMTDLQSPLSNASSHYGRNVGSIEFSSSVYAGQSPEAHSLVLSLLLCDTFVDLHKDVIFDSCPLCVCTMNIQGSEMGLYVPSSSTVGDSHNQWQSYSKCNCGFSAARHRYLSYKTGLFYEDEFESTGVWRCQNTQSSTDDKRYSPDIVRVIRHQSLTTDLTRSLYLAQSFARRNGVISQKYNLSDLELNDFAELCNIAMEQACMVIDCTTPTREDLSRAKSSLVHSWGFFKSRQPVSNSEVISVMKSLLPILQESVQKPRGVWQAKHMVEGPLTWRQFHRKCFHRVGVAGREDFSGPEPVPLLLMATEREWVTLSPFSVRLWDRLSLEAFGQPKDVVYLAVVPENQNIQNKARAFFHELSKVYEGLRLGRHCPLTRVLKSGIMKVGKAHRSNLRTTAVDPWFDRFDQCSSSSSSTSTSKNTMVSRFKLYAQVFRHHLTPHLASENLYDRSLLRDNGKESQSSNVGGLPTDSTMPPPPMPSQPATSSADSASDPSATTDANGADSSEVDNSPLPYVVVIYLVNPFTYGAETEDEEQNRLASTALFRSYLEMLKDLPDNLKGSIQLQVVPLQTILEFSLPNENEFLNGNALDSPMLPRLSLSQSDYFRQLALNVFVQSRNVGLTCMMSLQAKPLTGFGPAASRIELIKKKLEKSPNLAYQIYCPPYILAPSFEHSAFSIAGGNAASSGADARDDCVRVLFVTYCLSEKQKWLMAAASDHQGALLENCVINLNVQDRFCAERRSVVWQALKKLWTFVCGMLATGSVPWRIVIGRLGRIGQEELKAWAHLLSKTQLRATSRSLRDSCTLCSAMPNMHETPSVLSACLVSTESDSHFRMFADSFAYDERFGQGAKQCPLSTPEDISCTHIMVFPTSALIQMNSSGVMSSSGVGQTDEDDVCMDVFVTMGDGWEMPDGIGIGEIGELISDTTNAYPNRLTDLPDDNIQQQPLALGYIVSTAPIDVTPDWFWADCPSARSLTPVHLRSSLHINTSGVQQNDDQFFTGAGKSGAGSHGHPLDSSLTTDVLRYVLETYNALSWLNLEPTTGDRRSCLPIHMQALCRLYKAIEDLL